MGVTMDDPDLVYYVAAFLFAVLAVCIYHDGQK
jgi:hypothetical protein